MLTCLLWGTLKIIERIWEIFQTTSVLWIKSRMTNYSNSPIAHLVPFSSPDPAIPLEKDRGLWERRAHALRKTEMGLACVFPPGPSCPLSLFLLFFLFSWGKTADKCQHCIHFKDSWCLIVDFIIIIIISLFSGYKRQYGQELQMSRRLWLVYYPSVLENHAEDDASCHWITTKIR